MKNKNLIIAAAAFTFAISTAFTNSTALWGTDVYIQVAADEEDFFNCINLGRVCGETPGNTCTINILATKYIPDCIVTVPGRMLHSSTCYVTLQGTNVHTILAFYDAR